MKKVLYLFDALKRGGAETSTLEIAKRFKNWVPVMVSIYEGTELKNDFEEAGIKVYSLDIKEKYGKGPLILTVSRLLIRKGYLDAINAIYLVLKKHPNVKYLIAGKGHD